MARAVEMTSAIGVARTTPKAPRKLLKRNMPGTSRRPFRRVESRKDCNFLPVA